MESFTNLEVWKKGMALVKFVYAVTKKWPSSERYALSTQIQQSASSVLANLAEGFSRSTAPDKSHTYTISRGECSETRAFLLIAYELQYISIEEKKIGEDLCIEVGKLLSGLINRYSQP